MCVENKSQTNYHNRTRIKAIETEQAWCQCVVYKMKEGFSRHMSVVIPTSSKPSVHITGIAVTRGRQASCCRLNCALLPFQPYPYNRQIR